MFTRIVHGLALAIVISVIIVFLGALAVETLPISQFPSIAPPSVVVAVSQSLFLKWEGEAPAEPRMP
jgi:HAE1 family hydrophobic/amphiphilic exporter-1